MGIKYFFSWFRKSFSSDIKTIKLHENFKNVANVDHFLIDMNGIFHYCCQKVYEYGSFKPRGNDDQKEPIKKTTSQQKQKQLYFMVGNYIDRLIRFVNPNKTVFLAVDGPAPLSKQCQQRSRRYRSAALRDDGSFDSNCITPGTQFLDYLSKYMEHFIRLKMNEKAWGDISVIYSSEKVPGEGEHKLVAYVRDHCPKEDHYLMQGMDADLIMLSLATHYPNFHILRENPYRYEHEYYYINMKNIRENLVNVLLTEQGMLEDKIYVNDFISMIFLTGNDFLPHLPTIEILEGGVENLYETYRSVVKQYGTLTNNVDRLDYTSLKYFIGTLSTLQVPFLQEKRSKSIEYPDRLLEKHTVLGNDGKFILNWDAYRKEYYTKKMGCKSEKQITEACVKYIEGLQWVLTYYTHGVEDWKWYYPYNYAPFLSDIADTLEKMIEMDKKKLIKMHKKEEKDKKKEVFSSEKAYHPFMQLLCVLPRQSKDLLPEPLSQLMMSDVLSEYYPDIIEIDMDGKHNDWEGVVLLPPFKFDVLEKEYIKIVKAIEPKDKWRNIHGKSFLYTYEESQEYDYKSYYGEIKKCKVKAHVLPY